MNNLEQKAVPDSTSGSPTVPAPSPLGQSVWPGEMQAAEQKLLQTRHERLPADGADAIPKHFFGLALSGGGIRSATFCLGVLQTLARARLLRAVDYLSTVSGGGYVGGFLGALIKLRGLVEAEQVLSDNHSKEINWLRENGRHLAPNGSGDLLTALAVQLRNWLSVVIMMGLTVLAVFLGANWLRNWWDGTELWLSLRCKWSVVAAFFAFPSEGEVWWWWSPWMLAPLAAATVAVALGWGYWLAVNPRLGWRGYLPLFTMTVFLTGCALVGWGADPASLNASEIRFLDYVLQKSAHLRESLGTAAWALKAAFFLGLGALLAHMVLLLVANLGVQRRLRATASPDSSGDSSTAVTTEIWRKIRNLYGGALKGALVCTGVALAFALLDSLGQSLYLGWYRGGGMVTAVKGLWAASGLATLLSLGEKLVPWAQSQLSGKGGKIPWQAVATCVGLVGFGLFLLNFNLLAHAVAWGFASPSASDPMQTGLLLAACLAGLLIAELQGRHLPFLNGSSLQLLYGSRLARAYLGATNPRRQQSRQQSVTNMVPGDDISLSTYEPHAKGGPLHIINVTFNETCSGKSQLEQRDRKGLPLAVGPCGLSVGRSHHVRWKVDQHTEKGTHVESPQHGVTDPDQFQMFPPRPGGTRAVENLSVGHWIALSGAAFGTGLGRLNSLGFSLVTGLANLRLGYWWDSGVNPAARFQQEVFPTLGGWAGRCFSALFPVQSYLYDEWLARFHGPARRHWYLSDGGHFENTGVYELLRRRVSHVLCCDCGADPEYNFGDLANLVRKARIDFGAEVRFASRNQLRQAAAHQKLALPKTLLSHIGLPMDFSEHKADGKQPHAVLAVVRFNHPSPGGQRFTLLLFLKPALSGDEPLDVWEYDAQRKDFPQESTADQFFDEAQWESYRKLGEHTAASVLTTAPNQPFWFTNLDPARVWALANSS